MAEITTEQLEIEDLEVREQIREEGIESLQSYFISLERALARTVNPPDDSRLVLHVLQRNSRLQRSLTPTVERAMRRGIFSMAEQFGPDAILQPRNAAVRRSIEAASHIDGTTIGQLKRVALRARHSKNPKFWQHEIWRIFEIYKTNRADLIAQYESALGLEIGRELSADNMRNHGREIQKYWNNVGDRRVTKECRANTAAGWIPYTAVFPAAAKYPPQHHRCRCWLTYREVGVGLLENVAGDPEERQRAFASRFAFGLGIPELRRQR